MFRALYDLQPRVPHLRFQGYLSQPAYLLRLREDDIVLMPKFQIPRLKDRLERVHGAAVVIPLERREEKVQNICVEPRDAALDLRGRVENQVQRVLRQEVGNLGDGLAELRAGFGVVRDCLEVLTRR